MIGFVNLRFAVSVSAAACQKHTLVAETDIIHNGKLIVGHGLLEGPKEIVRSGHQQGGVLGRIFLIPAKRWIWILLRNAVEPLHKCFQLG